MSRIIDVHAHLIAPELVKVIRRDGARYGIETGGNDKQPTVKLAGSALTKPLPLQTSIAMARMIFSGTLSRHKRLRIRFPHAGGYLPCQTERVRRVHAVRPEGKEGGLNEDPLEILKRCYFDTVTHSPLALRYLAELVGADRLLLGSDYPFDMAEPDPVGTVKRAFSGEPLPPILGETAARLLGLD